VFRTMIGDQVDITAGKLKHSKPDNHCLGGSNRFLSYSLVESIRNCSTFARLQKVRASCGVPDF
jgi:hypothetical protein